MELDIYRPKRELNEELNRKIIEPYEPLIPLDEGRKIEYLMPPVCPCVCPCVEGVSLATFVGGLVICKEMFE